LEPEFLRDLLVLMITLPPGPERSTGEEGKDEDSLPDLLRLPLLELRFRLPLLSCCWCCREEEKSGAGSASDRCFEEEETGAATNGESEDDDDFCETGLENESSEARVLPLSEVKSIESVDRFTGVVGKPTPPPEPSLPLAP